MYWCVRFDVVPHPEPISTHFRPLGATVPQIHGPSEDEPQPASVVAEQPDLPPIRTGDEREPAAGAIDPHVVLIATARQDPHRLPS